MMDPVLQACLRPLIRRRRWERLGWWLALGWGFAGLVGLGLMGLRVWVGAWGSWVWLGMGVATTVVLLGWAGRRGSRDLNLRQLACDVEARHPELEGRLLTAVEQEVGPGGQLSFLQDRLVNEVLRQGSRVHWVKVLPRWRVVLAQTAQGLGLIGLLALVWGLWPVDQPRAGGIFGAREVITGLEITPGDTELERGSSLVIMARFGGEVPTRVELVVNSSAGVERRSDLVRSLDARLLGGTVAEVTEDLTYHVEHGDQRTRDFRVKVFEYPRLEKADAVLTYPDYTGLESRRIEDTRRVSAVEGTRLEWSLALNKPVASARLVARSGAGAAIELQTESLRPLARLEVERLSASGTYGLELVDADGRTNKVPALFVVEVLTNRVPELRLIMPRGDQRPSPIEELTFEGTVWDDFGVLTYGLAWGRAGEEARWIELGSAVPGRQKTEFRKLLRLEEEGVEPEEVLLWYAWADDLGPDGERRRTMGDLFFGEVRRLDEIFREAEQGAGGSGGAGGRGEGDGEGPGGRLAELQKQIINATWRLQREAGERSGDDYASDMGVIRDSQEEALAQAETARIEAAASGGGAALWDEVVEPMQQAVEHLSAAGAAPESLKPALAAEQAAYQALVRLQQREYAVSQQRSQSGGGGARSAQMQRQLDQLEFAQSENRYETERQALAPESPERREQLQVLNRLQELARRQQDLNERLREVQAALAAARDEEERDELRRRLQRLEDEQRQMLADVDELQQRMDRPENQSRMAESREQLGETREDMRRAAEAAAEGSVSQALASGTRAQRQMEEMREQMRQQSASAFAEDLRRMRSAAREVSRRQSEIRESMDDLVGNRNRTLSGETERESLLNRLEAQREGLERLVGEATRVSQEAEASEPLVSRELYDALRQFSQDEASHVRALREELIERGIMTRALYDRIEDTAADDGPKSVSLAAELLRRGYLAQADEAEERARVGVEGLRRGVERAAERVLGDDIESLRRAARELELAAADLEREMAEAAAGESEGGDSAAVGDRQASAEVGEGAQTGRGEARQPGELARQEVEGGEERPGAAAGQGGGQAVQPQGGGPGEAGVASGAQGGNQGGPTTRGGTGRPGDGAAESAGIDLDRVLGGQGRGGGGGAWSGPIAGEGFGEWSDRMREVEEMLDLPELRNAVTRARERARGLRQEYRRDLRKPDWAVVRLEVMGPLVEVRKQIGDELARRDPGETLAPIDRDPVPGRFMEVVRRYYEQLGEGR
jgi:hypothetical protein